MYKVLFYYIMFTYLFFLSISHRLKKIVKKLFIIIYNYLTQYLQQNKNYTVIKIEIECDSHHGVAIALFRTSADDIN